MKTKSTAAVLAFFLGGFGGHKFYLGQNGWGLAYLMMCWTFIPAFVSIIEFFMLLVMDEQTFNKRFNAQYALASPQGASPQNTMAQNIVVNVPSSATGGGADRTTQLAKLNELRVSGALTEDEFAEEKRRVLAS